MFTGGALSRLTVCGLGVMPYISASIIMELLAVVSPHLAELKNRVLKADQRLLSIQDMVLYLFQ